jgi:hypothetical protein
MLERGNININFAQGLDTKNDPKQLSTGKFLKLENSVFTTGGRLSKRNGYSLLTTLPSTSPASYLTTFNNNLVALGQSLYAYGSANSTWTNSGKYYPLELSTLPVIRNGFNQEQADAVVAPNGLICIAYTEVQGSTTYYKFAVVDSTTGLAIVPPTPLPAAGTIDGSPRVFLLGTNFVIVFTQNNSGQRLTYVTINSLAPAATGLATNDFAVGYTPYSGLSWDGVVVGNNIYFAYDTTSGGQTVAVTYLTEAAAVTGGTAFTPNVTPGSGKTATLVSLSVDMTVSNTPNIYVSFYNSGSSTGYTYAVNSALVQTLAATEIISSGTIDNLTSVAQNGVCTFFYEVANNYGYDSSIPTHYIRSNTITSTGTVGTSFISARSIGIASKAFLVSGNAYYLAAYESSAAAGAGYQPTYFLMDGTNSTAASPKVVAKLAYSNGGGYVTTGLPSVTVSGEVAQFAYLYKDLIESQAPALVESVGAVAPALYTQTGVNLATVTLPTTNIDSINPSNTSSLQMTGGFGWMYDGVQPIEENFFLWPDSVEVATATTGGNIVGQPTGWVSGQPSYYVQAIYSWTDNQGNAYNSAPSIPVAVTGLTNSTTYTFTYYVPTLRLTYKISTPITIRVYRWSVANQNYYETTSITSPVLNDTTVDYVTITDTQADASIVGNNLLYTTGGVVENVNSPASSVLTIFDTRAWKVDAEDPNLLWYSKQIIENTPVEWSDLFTYYVAPNTGTSTSVGPVTALAPMDDKLIIFHADAIYFINGTGPDNTGANSSYPNSPYFITSTVGCTNQQSIVLMQDGLQFQTEKGIWLLGRDLQTVYLGAPVEAFTTSTVNSSVNVPETTQVRFTLSSGQTLMYDYYYQQWGTFTGVPAVSSCLFQGSHTFLDKYGRVFQETEGSYLDGSNPVLMSFQTGPIVTSGISGYQRIYWIALTGSYSTPHKLNIQIAFNYGASSQYYQILPSNYTGVYGSDSLYGQTSPYGGPGNLEQWRIQLQDQQCQSFQISLQETFDPTYGTVAGAGFTLSNMNCLVGIKKGIRPFEASKSTG